MRKNKDLLAKELISIIETVRNKFTDESDLLWTSYETANEVRDELDDCISRLNVGDKSCLENLNMHFLVTSTFQEHSLMNGWSEEFLGIAEKFDKIYAEMKKE